MGPGPARSTTPLFLLVALMAALVTLEMVRGHAVHSLLLLPVMLVPMIAVVAQRGLADEVWLTDTELLVVRGRVRTSVPLRDIQGISVQPWGNVVTLRLTAGRMAMAREVRFLAPPRRGGGAHFVELELRQRMDALRRDGA